MGRRVGDFELRIVAPVGLVRAHLLAERPLKCFERDRRFRRRARRRRRPVVGIFRQRLVKHVAQQVDRRARRARQMVRLIVMAAVGHQVHCRRGYPVDRHEVFALDARESQRAD
jgi:hypothetical protein